MRTKHLLTAIMLPALFAACTNDDFQAIEQGAQGMEGRRMVGNVTLEVNTPAETRLAYGDDGYKFKDGDEIGACLMDVITSEYQSTTNPLWHTWFTLTDYIHTNYKFTRDNGEWTTGAKMSEGNYFFVMPYNANYGYRHAYKFDATYQTLEGTDKASLLKAYANNNHFVGYGKVQAGDSESENVKVDMVPVFGNTGITIKNTGSGTYTIERIVLRGKNVNSGAVLNPTSCTDATQYNGVTTNQTSSGYVDYAGMFNMAQYLADPVETYHATLNKNGLYNPNFTAYSSVNAMKDVLDYNNAGQTDAESKVEVTIKSGNVLTPQKSINVIAMLGTVKNIPAATNVGTASATNEDLVVLDIYTDKGIIKDICLNYKYTANDKDNAAMTNVLTDMALDEIGGGNKVEVTFDDTSLDKPATMDVDNAADLATLIHWNAATATGITANLKANVAITKAMYDELKGSKITSATINGSTSTYSVTVDADVADGALDAFTFTDVKTVTIKGTQSIAKAPTSPVEVAAGATLNISGDLTQTDAMTEAITNKGTLNVKANVNAKRSMTAILNYATMDVASGKTIMENAEVQNGKTLTYAGTLTNAGTIEVLDNQEGTVTNTGVIGENLAVDAITNGSNSATIINNNGKVFLAANTGDIYANGTSTTRLASNTDGNLIITKLDVANGNFLTGSSAKGDIVQEITADANTDAVDVRANTIWLNASLKVEKKDKDGNYVEVDLTGTSMKNGAMKVIATGADARIDGNDQKFRMNAIEVNKDAKLVLNNVQMIISGDDKVTMHGEVNHKAMLTINSNASLQVAKKGNVQITVNETYDGNNVLDNNSSNTTISF